MTVVQGIEIALDIPQIPPTPMFIRACHSVWNAPLKSFKKTHINNEI